MEVFTIILPGDFVPNNSFNIFLACHDRAPRPIEALTFWFLQLKGIQGPLALNFGDAPDLQWIVCNVT